MNRRKILNWLAASPLAAWTGFTVAKAESVSPVKASSFPSIKDDLLLYTHETATLGRQHEEWLKRLQDVEEGKIKRLLGLTPQGWGRNYHTSVIFPTHFLGRFPGKKIIVSTDWQAESSWDARNVVSRPYYKKIFNTELIGKPLRRFDSSPDEWELSNGSCYFYRSIFQGYHALRADGIIWYDPVNEFRINEYCESKTARDKTWENYISDLVTRKAHRDAWEVGICSRQHKDDLPGRILPVNYNNETGWVKGQDGNDWYVVCLPNIYDWLKSRGV